jgi:hypothetical protein
MVEVTASLLMHTSTVYLDIQASWEKCTISLLRELLVRHPDETTHENVQKLLKNTPAAVNVVRRTLDLLLGFNIQPGKFWISLLNLLHLTVPRRREVLFRS